MLNKALNKVIKMKLTLHNQLNKMVKFSNNNKMNKKDNQKSKKTNNKMTKIFNRIRLKIRILC